MTSSGIDDYLAGVDEPKRATLQALRGTIRELLPDAEETISYGMPAYKVNGVTVAGFAAFKNHLSYLPHSGSVIDKVPEAVAAYDGTKGSLHFPVDQPLPRDLVRELLKVRLDQAGVNADLR